MTQAVPPTAPVATAAPVAPAAVTPPVATPPVAPVVDNQPAPVVQKIEGLDPKFYDKATGQVIVEELAKAYVENGTKLSTFEAKLAEVPAEPKDYKLEFPADFKAPDGIELKINEDDPRLGPAREFAKSVGLTNGDFSKMLALDAQMQIVAAQQAEARYVAEKAKLGEKGPARVEAVNSFLKANLAADEFAAMQSVATNAKAVEAMEKLIAKATAAGIPAQVTPAPTPAASAVPVEQRWYPDSTRKVS